MPAVPIITAATAAYGAYSASQANKQAGNYMSAQQGAAQQNQALLQQFMARQQGLYGPLESQMVQEASGNGPLDYGLISGQVQGNFDNAQRNLGELAASRGLSASGLYGGATSGMEIGRANSLSDAFQRGLAAKRQFQQAILSRYNPAQGVGMASQGLQNSQNLYGQFANTYMGAAQQGWQGVGSALGSLSQYYGLNNAQNTSGIKIPTYVAPSDIPPNPTADSLWQPLSPVPAFNPAYGAPSGLGYPMFGNNLPAIPSNTGQAQLPSYTPMFGPDMLSTIMAPNSSSVSTTSPN